jgi:8-oxo-dGTP pyrophosphatase MutT (NUDIX family)
VRDDVSALLAGWEPADDAEAARLDEIRAAWALRGESLLVRSTFDPGHLTASAVVWSVDGATVALVWHETLKRWLQPGGHVEASDADLESAARREVEEEVGATDLVGLGPVDVDVHVIPPNPRKNEPEHRHFDIRFGFRIDGPVWRTPGVRWVTPAEIRAVETDDSVVRLVERVSRRRG